MIDRRNEKPSWTSANTSISEYESSSLGDEKVRPVPSIFSLISALSNESALFPPVTGVLKGYDQLLNLVMDDVEENLKGAELKRMF